MAAVALPVLAAKALGTTVGAATGGSAFAVLAASVIGSYVDSTFLLPRLLRDKDTDEAKNIQISGLDEGDPHSYAIGPRTRMPGFLYWTPETPRFTPAEEGGKGGGSSKSGTSERYNSDGVYVVSRTGIDGNTGDAYPSTTQLRRVWLDGKLRYFSDSAARSSSLGWEIYESVENDGGYVSLVYTIQGKTVAGPPGQNPQQYTFEDRFVPGERIRGSGSVVVGELGPLLQDNVRYEDGSITPRPFKLLGSGFLADGRPYLQIEWEYWSDESLWRRLSVGFGETGPRYSLNPDFYQVSSNFEGSGVVAGNRVLFDAFADQTWASPLGTTPAATSTGVQERGYASQAHANLLGVVIFQQYRSFDQGLATAFGVRNGTETTAPSVIVREEVDSPALTSFTSLVIDNLLLRDFGNRMPNVEVEVAQDSDSLPIDQAIYRILCVHHDLPANKLDVTALEGTGITVDGYWWSAPFGPEVLQPLVIAYDLTMIELEGKLVFRRRVDNPEYTVPEEDLGVEFYNDGKYFAVSEKGRADQVVETTVTYTDLDAGMSKGSQVFRRPDLFEGNIQTIDLSRLSLTAREAREIAQRTTWQASMFKQELSLSLGPKWGILSAGDVLNFTVYGKSWRMVVTEVTRGVDGRVECEGYSDDGIVEDMPTLNTDLGGAPGGKGITYVPADTKVVAMDIGPLSLQDALTPGLYLAGCAKLFGADWRGGTWSQSVGTPIDTTTLPEYSTIDTTFSESVVGTLVSNFPTGSPDLVNTLQEPVLIRVMHGELESAPDIENVYDREYLMYIDGEVIAYEKVELVPDPEYGGPLYQLTGRVLRGLYNTEHLISLHQAGSPVVAITRSQIERVEVTADAIDNTELRYALSPSATSTPVYDSEEYGFDVIHPRGFEEASGGEGLNAGANGRPFPPSHIRSSSELTVSNLDFWTFGSILYNVGDRVRTVDGAGLQVAWVCRIQHSPAETETNTGDDHYPPNEDPINSPYWELLDPQPRDIRIKWNFRTPVPIAGLPTTTAETLRGVTTFTVRIYNTNGNPPSEADAPARIIRDIFATEYLYTDAQQDEDGVTSGRVWVELRADTDYMTSEWAEGPIPNDV